MISFCHLFYSCSEKTTKKNKKSLKQTIFLLVPFWFGFWFSWSDESWLIWVWFNSLSFFLLIPFSFNWASDCLISRGVGFSLRIPSSTTKNFLIFIYGFSISYCDFSEGLWGIIEDNRFLIVFLFVMVTDKLEKNHKLYLYCHYWLWPWSWEGQTTSPSSTDLAAIRFSTVLKKFYFFLCM